MSATRLLNDLRIAGFTVIAEGETLHVQGPIDTLTTELREEIRLFKRELLALFNGEREQQPSHQRYVVFAFNREICHLVNERDRSRHATHCGIFIPQDTHNRYKSGREVPALFDDRPIGYRLCHPCQIYAPYRDYEADEQAMQRSEWEASNSRCGCVLGMRHTIHWYWSDVEGRFWCRTCYPERVALFLKPCIGFEHLSSGHLKKAQ